MQTFTFDIRFRFDSALYHETSFQLSLNDEEIDFVKSFIKENGEKCRSGPSSSKTKSCSTG